MTVSLKSLLPKLKEKFTGEILTDELSKNLYARDASIYEITPQAVALPKTQNDLLKLVRFADQYQIPLTPRTAGTSLAGQAIGKGIIVDQSKYLNQILELNADEKSVRVQPGVVRDELNHALAPHGLFFGVNTSTSNRAMIGGMVGNNSSGSLSITYGTTRENVTALKCILSNGEEVEFKVLNHEEFSSKQNEKNLEGAIYRQLNEILSNEENQSEIKKQFPYSKIHRRNNGYAIDLIDLSAPNLCQILVGSEGSLALISEITLKLNDLPPAHEVLVCSHFNELKDSLKTAQVAVDHQAYMCELMDKVILDCTKSHSLYSQDRFFIEGDPKAIIMTEFRGETEAEAIIKTEHFLKSLKSQNLGYHHSIVKGVDTKRVWNLRSAGLGLLANLPGEGESVVSIEDTAVNIADLPSYIEELDLILRNFKQTPTYYAHAGAGELHVRPYLNLRKQEEVHKLEEIIIRTAHLVKKYRGSLSGEHGDGRIRSPFIPIILGDEIPKIFKALKTVWDPKNIFNPNIKVDPLPVSDAITLQQPQAHFELTTAFDFSAETNMARLAGKCTGSGDCRKHPLFGGVMCPSYQATKNEKDSTRGRAHALFKVLSETNQNQPKEFLHRFKSPDLKEAMDLCLSCKGCTAECPSNVDVALLKSEYLYQRHRAGITNFSEKLFAFQPQLLNAARKTIGSKFYNSLFSKTTPLASILKKISGVHPKRKIPALSPITLEKWFQQKPPIKKTKPLKTVYLFCDEFTNQFNLSVGQMAVKLLGRLGYEVKMIPSAVSGRTFISKGFLDEAKKCAEENIKIFSPIISKTVPLLGIEPSAILTFKDEYPRLLRNDNQLAAQRLKEDVFLLDDFLAEEIKIGNVTADQFKLDHQTIHFHGHCHQKALSKTQSTKLLLSLPKNYTVKLIPAGCCGMAGSFGYEKKHYEVSQKIFNLALHPYLKTIKENDLVATTGISCHEQILAGAGITTQHPMEILWKALK